MQEAENTAVAERVYEAVEAAMRSLPQSTPRCEYEYLPTDAAELPCVSVQTLSGTPVEREYLDGSYIGAYRFGLVLRRAADDTRSRLDAPALLGHLAEALKAAAIDLGDAAAFWGVSRDTLPARVASDPAWIDYQVTLTLKYKAHK